MGRPKKSPTKKFQIAEIIQKWLEMIAKGKIMKNEKKSLEMTKKNSWGKMGRRWSKMRLM